MVQPSSGRRGMPKLDTWRSAWASLRRQVREALWTPLVGWLVVVGVACFLFAWLLFDPDQGHFRRQVSDSLLQLAAIGLVGGVIAGLVKHAFDRYNEIREKHEHDVREREAKEGADRAKRLDFLARMRGIHAAVAYAQWLIRAHGTRPAVYDEQMRELMRATNQLWEIDADLEAAERLFEPHDALIREGITGIIDFLGDLTEEYEQSVDDLSPDDGFGDELRPRLAAFLERPEDRKRRLPIEYDTALDASKGVMRASIYKDKPPDA
jgi:hypothetical protein